MTGDNPEIQITVLKFTTLCKPSLRKFRVRVNIEIHYFKLCKPSLRKLQSMRSDDVQESRGKQHTSNIIIGNNLLHSHYITNLMVTFGTRA